METDNTKLCINCLHYKAGSGAAFDRCKKRVISPALKYVRGEDGPYGFCEETRGNSTNCGPLGVWFETKPCEVCNLKPCVCHDEIAESVRVSNHDLTLDQRLDDPRRA